MSPALRGAAALTRVLGWLGGGDEGGGTLGHRAATADVHGA